MKFCLWDEDRFMDLSGILYRIVIYYFYKDIVNEREDIMHPYLILAPIFIDLSREP